METVEQRRVRLALVIDPALRVLPRINWHKERFARAYALADAIIASDEAAGLVVVPKIESVELLDIKERLDVLIAKALKE